MQAGESFQGSLTSEELKSTLCVFNPPHTKEPHQEVESIHQKRSEHWPLSQEETEHWKCKSTGNFLMNISYYAPVFLRNTEYLSHWFFFQVSSGSTGDRHVILHWNKRKTFSDALRSFGKKRSVSNNSSSWLSSKQICNPHTTHSEICCMSIYIYKKWCLTGFSLMLWRPSSTFSMSANLVAPSASAIRMSFPRQLSAPWAETNTTTNNITATVELSVCKIRLLAELEHSSLSFRHQVISLISDIFHILNWMETVSLFLSFSRFHQKCGYRPLWQCTRRTGCYLRYYHFNCTAFSTVLHQCQNSHFLCSILFCVFHGNLRIHMIKHSLWLLYIIHCYIL